jgi:hypothetical protein
MDDNGWYDTGWQNSSCDWGQGHQILYDTTSLLGSMDGYHNVTWWRCSIFNCPEDFAESGWDGSNCLASQNFFTFNICYWWASVQGHSILNIPAYKIEMSGYGPTWPYIESAWCE